MLRQHDIRAHFRRPLHYRVEIIHFKPEQNAVAVGLAGGIADAAVMMLDFKAMQLKNQLIVCNQLLVMGAAVSTRAAEQALVPTAAGFHIGDGDQRLGTHIHQRTKWPSRA